MTQLNRRSLITGLISLVAAPAIVRAGSLMPVKTMMPLIEVEARHFVVLCPEQYADLLKVRIALAYDILEQSLKKNMEEAVYRQASSAYGLLSGLSEVFD